MAQNDDVFVVLNFHKFVKLMDITYAKLAGDFENHYRYFAFVPYMIYAVGYINRIT